MVRGQVVPGTDGVLIATGPFRSGTGHENKTVLKSQAGPVGMGPPAAAGRRGQSSQVNIPDGHRLPRANGHRSVRGRTRKAGVPSEAHRAFGATGSARLGLPET